MSAPDVPRRSRLVVPVVVALSLAMVTAALLVGPGQGGDRTGRENSAATQPADPSGQQPPGPGPEGAAPMARRHPGDPMALGRSDAPVVMVSYSEFQCPFCGRFARDTEPTLIRDYVDKGVLRIEWRDFPYLGEESLTAARAGRAAAAQGRFWQFHDAMYAAHLPPNSGRLTPAYVKGVAARIGLDPAQFAKDLGSAEFTGAIQRDFQEGQAIGVTGTPAFIINGRPVIGAQPTAEFVRVIEQAAKSAS